MNTNAQPDAHRCPRLGRPPHRGGRVWTMAQIAGLGAVTDLPTAAAILGISRTTAYDLARRGQFPVPVLRAGTRYRVPVAPLLAALGRPHPPPPTPAGGRPPAPRLDPGAGPSIDHHQQSQARCPACGHPAAGGAPDQGKEP